MRFLHKIKKVIVLLGAAIVFSFFCVNSIRAADQPENVSGIQGYLYYIMEYTYEILQDVNNLPDYMNTLSAMAISWMTLDDSDTTTQMQSSFAALGNAVIQDFNTQNSFQVQMTADITGQNVSTFTTPADHPSILDSIPNINDLSYVTLLGQPPVPKGATANSPYNYIKNAGALTTYHTAPGLNWQGAQEDQAKYQNYYNTILAIESFSGYVLSTQYADLQNGSPFSTAQLSLISQASNSTWIAQIATEELGKVFRQLLMFESQSYILLSQLVQTQRQMVMAQAMTNSLMVLLNQNNENLLSAKAQGVQPKP